MKTDTDLIERLARHRILGPALERAARNNTALALNGAGAAAHGYLIASALTALCPEGPVLVVTPSNDAADRLLPEIDAWSRRSTALLPASDPYLPGPDPMAAARLETLDRLDKGEPLVVVASLAAILQRVPRAIARVVLKPNEEADLTRLAAQLGAMGYERVTLVERPGQFSVRGGILDVFPSTAERPVRADFFGDSVETLRAFDPETQRSAGDLDEVVVLPAAEAEARPGEATALDFLREGCACVVVEANAVQGHWAEFVRAAEAQYAAVHQREEDVVRIARARPIAETHAAEKTFLDWLGLHPRMYLDVLERANPWEAPGATASLSSLPVEVYRGNIDALARDLQRHLADGMAVAIVSANAGRLRQLLADRGVEARSPDEDGGAGVTVVKAFQRAGFRLPDLGLMALSDAEVFGERDVHPQRRVFKEAQPISSLLELKSGDLVVHVNHGIGHYRGLSTIRNTDGSESEFLRIDYAGNDKIYVPTDQMDRVQKYIGGGGSAPTVNRLGGGDWARTTRRAKAKAREMAAELVALYAARQAVKVAPAGSDTSWQQEMESAFPYVETPDQEQAIREVKGDLMRTTPMDRLICGDVGFGKTEVAVRAAFKMVIEGRQVAVLAPTTILAEQHWSTFRERMGAFPVRIEMLSRFRSAKEAREVRQGLRDGTVDIVIGTHMLLGKNVTFADLGLLIVDEEQRFGVAHKERIKQLKKTVHVLTLTATPIPRTLNMSLSGIRDLSIMNDPPEGRTPIRTILTESSVGLVREAILHELDRGGQVYFVYNRVQDIDAFVERIRKIVPTARIVVGHGQMPERQLEQVMWDFYRHKFDVLVCTTIIESGLDVPNANTIIIYNADRFGLATLYQLRGRVGRSPRQAYCYLLYQPHREISEEAQARLQAVREFTELGSGFKIAMRDLEIRGAGNLLGAEQSGSIVSVGYEMYVQMIQQAIAEFKGEDPEEFTLPSADLPVSAFIPMDYISDDGLRIAFYKRIASVRDEAGLNALQEELEDRFGDPPKPVWAMLHLLALRLKMKEAGIPGLSGNAHRVLFRLPRNLSPSERFALQRRRKRWVVETATIEVPVGHANPLRSAEEALPRIIGDLAGEPVRVASA